MTNTRILQETAVRYFLEVVRRGSITEAALTLNVASSAISRQIARLEDELDTPLFERVSRGMKPNAAGELLAAHALRAQLETERIGNELLALKGLRRGEVNWPAPRVSRWIFCRRRSNSSAAGTAAFASSYR